MTVIESSDLCAHPKVSVLMLAYNHAPFIEEAVRSALAQRASFPYEVVVGDDLSTDGTREKLVALQREFPDRLRLVFHEKNLGSMGKHNLVAVMARCRGLYVTVLDGDDYYNDPQKLQLQADFLDGHPECPACFHNYWRTHLDGTKLRGDMQFMYQSLRRADTVTLADFMEHGFPHILTMMFWKGVFGEYPGWFAKVAMPDWSTWMLLGERGPVGYVRGEPLATYRGHAHNHWVSRPLLNRTRDELFALRTFNDHLGGRFELHLGKQINQREFWLVHAFCERNEFDQTRTTYWHAFNRWWNHRGVTVREVVRYRLQAHQVRSVPQLQS